MLGISTTNARVGGYRKRGSSIDPDAQAFITAGGTYNATQITAINFIFKSLKGTEISYNPTAIDFYSRIPAFWILIGGTAASTKYNAKNPIDSDAAFRLAYSGGWTYSASGAKGNGTNSSANTFIQRNSLSILTNSFGVYFLENTKRTSDVQMGFYNTTTFRGTELGVAFSSNNKGIIGNASSQIFTPTTYTDINGFNRNNRNSAAQYKIFRNGVVFETVAALGIADSSTETFVIGGEKQSTGTVNQFSNKTIPYADFMVSTSFTDAEELVYYNIIQQFMTILGIQV